jgi:uncharacterized protein (TIGR02145 family)
VKNQVFISLTVFWRLLRHFGLHAAVHSFFFFTFGNASAQAPQGIPYQAIARNASGVAIANTAVKVRFSIRDSIATGPVKYQETHNPTTSALGLFSVNVGMGTVVSGSFSGINWGKNAKFLQVELDLAGGNNYTDLGTTQMMSVPYALQANSIKMKTSATGDTLYTGGGNYLIIPNVSQANSNYVTDIDGNVYQKIKIGNQEWLDENLRVSRYNNGDSILSGLNITEWKNTTYGAYSLYENSESNNLIYGKLYNWYAVSDPRKLCPLGYHVPSDSEWKSLETFLGMTPSEIDLLGERGALQNVGGKLKKTGILQNLTGQWLNPNQGATNETKFNGLPGGHRYYGDPGGGSGYIYITTSGYWWTSTSVSIDGAYYRLLYYNNGKSNRSGADFHFGFSVRCIKD